MPGVLLARPGGHGLMPGHVTLHVLGKCRLQGASRGVILLQGLALNLEHRQQVAQGEKSGSESELCGVYRTSA